MRKFLLEIKKECIKSAMLYWSKTWCLRENEVTVLRTENAMVRSMCGAKMIEKRKSQKLMSSRNTLDGLARVCGVTMICACFEKG